MNVRPFNSKDKEAVVSLWERCELVVPWNDPEKDIARKLKVGAELFYVGLVSEQVIASIMGGYDGHRGAINYLAVHPDHRHKGCGTQLMAVIEEQLIAIGCAKLNLQVRGSNKSAIEFYRRLDYKEDAVVSFGKRLISDA